MPLVTTGQIDPTFSSRRILVLVLGLLCLIIGGGEIGLGATIYDEFNNIGLFQFNAYYKVTLHFLGAWWGSFGVTIAGILTIAGAVKNRREPLIAAIPVAILGAMDALGGCFIEGYYHYNIFRSYTACVTATNGLTDDSVFSTSNTHLTFYGASADYLSAANCLQSYYIANEPTSYCYCVKSGGFGCLQVIQTNDATKNLKHDCGVFVVPISGSYRPCFYPISVLCILASFDML